MGGNSIDGLVLRPELVQKAYIQLVAHVMCLKSELSIKRREPYNFEY